MQTAIRNNYHILSYTADGKIIGKGYPQVLRTEGDADLLRPLYFSENTFPEIKEYPNLCLRRGGKVTDFVSTGFQSFNGFYVSDRVKNILEQFHSTRIRFYNCFLNTGDELLIYHWLHLTSLIDRGETILKYLDFGKSHFFVGDAIQREIRDAEIYSLDDYYSQKKRIMSQSDNKELLWLKEPCFSHEILAYDMFAIQPLGLRCFISQRLRSGFEEEGISGILMRPALMQISDQ